MIVEFQRPHRCDAGIILAAEDELASAGKIVWLLLRGQDRSGSRSRNGRGGSHRCHHRGCCRSARADRFLTLRGSLLLCSFRTLAPHASRLWFGRRHTAASVLNASAAGGADLGAALREGRKPAIGAAGGGSS